MQNIPLNRVIPVGKISGYIKNIFDSEEMLHDVYVSGEVVDIKIISGNAYFSLIDSDNRLNCTYFAADIRDYRPKEGEKCIVKGSISYYKKGGRISLNATGVFPAGLGAEYLRLLKLKENLQSEGLFDQSRKLRVPLYPDVITVITSAEGAALQDILKIMREKAPHVDVVVLGVRVQGVYASEEITSALKSTAAQGADVIIVARGGGSKEDLSAFNTESVARAVANINVPVISAVGHETDYTLCDLAADLRASTPTNAADMATEGFIRLKEYLYNGLNSIERATTEIFNSKLTEVKSLVKDIYYYADTHITKELYDINNMVSKIEKAQDNIFQKNVFEINNLMSSIDAKSPLKTLSRGYAAVTNTFDKTVYSINDINEGDKVNITFKDGRASAAIENIYK